MSPAGLKERAQQGGDGGSGRARRHDREVLPVTRRAPVIAALLQALSPRSVSNGLMSGYDLQKNTRVTELPCSRG